LPESDTLALLVDAARAAGDISLRHWRSDHRVWDKGDGQGPVTEADLECDVMLRARLLGACPDHGWLSEETEDDADRRAARMASKRLFIVDPIDGTRAFTRGDDAWAHSLAVVEAGQVVAGVVYLPALERMFTATRGGGAYLNGAPIRAGEGRNRLLAHRAVFASEYWPGGVPEVSRHSRPSLAYRLALVAQGRYDGMMTFRPTWEWDIAAGVLLCSEAGAVVTDRTGGPVAFNSVAGCTTGLIAASAALHADLMDRL